MIAALISDVHGNLPALKAVLKDADRAKARQIWYLGDFVGYIPFPNECVERIRKKADVAIIGNYDQSVMAFEEHKNEWKKSKKPPKFDALAWNSGRLASQSRQYLKDLPENIRLEIGGFEILLTHGSPMSIDEPVLPETPEKRLVELGAAASADIIIMGHSHQFMSRRAGKHWFINPGSVGLPAGNDWRASYALLEIAKNKINVVERKIDYDITPVIEAMREANLSRSFIEMVQRDYGIDLNKQPRSRDAGPKNEKSRSSVIKAVRRFAGDCDYGEHHGEQVTLLALILFDELRPLHHLGDDDRFFLQCAGLLHDIGWMSGQRGHHKVSMRLILDSKKLPLTDKQRIMIALIARYHRKTLPKATHPIYSQLPKKDRQRVKILAGILRIADGLDRTHADVIQSLRCEPGPNDILVECRAAKSPVFEMEEAGKKSNLLKEALMRNFRFTAVIDS
jgi:putative phosphoesterase